MIENAVLVIEDGRIAGCFQGEAPAAPAGEPTTAFDFPGCTILPGLIDTHVHLNLPGDGLSLEDAVREDDGVLVAISMANAARALRAGITTVRDVGGARNTVFHVRRALSLGYGEGPRVLACGQPITITGGHTWYFGGEADGEEGVRHKVRTMAKAGSDFTKVMATGGGTLNTMSWLPSFRLSELMALADESHRLGRRITAHCLCAQAIEWVVQAGFDQIEHGGFLVAADGRQEFDPRAAEKVAKAGIPVTSTLAVGGYMLKEYRARQARGPLPPQDQRIFDRWQRMFDDNLEQFRRMREAGVTWVAGTDAGWRFTAIEGLPLELELMREGGLSAMEAIVAGTGLAARTIGIDDKVGTLKPGRIADVVVVGGDPLADLARLTEVRMVMQAGRVCGSR
ncbi:MAG: amidohydrolase family protein [Rhodospirillales bacterium]|nr:amidohydrolase family protein [Rhodospirillales bacterium]